jgi:DNA sulfur modification protein DndB
MNEDKKIALLGRLVTGSDLKNELKLRKNDFIFESVSESKREEFENDGWQIDRLFSRSKKIKFKKQKPVDIRFEDKVWTMLANLGFTFLNKNRSFHLPYDNDNSQQIDIIAKDDECILLIECKATESNKRGDFKKDLEAMAQKMAGLRKSIQILFPDSKLKFKFILATSNYAINEQDEERLKNIHGLHLDEEAIQYFADMHGEIGLAARYQFLGTLFDNQEIPEIDNTIPAIQGKMGGHTYYSFSIEPEKLLKISYVLHRNKANKKMMPTYQRIIKKSRIQGVQNFISNDGYFPNSIIISLDSGSKPLRFDRANTQVKSSISNIGILHLPKKYRSAFVIDGQHRLYGYANTEYKMTNSIPVVAFVNLDREEQIKLFMQINENQKQVPKNLRNTLISDLLWTSDSFMKRLDALKSRMSIELGENRESPLFDRVIIGENKKNQMRCVTTDTIIRALSKSNFLGKVTKTKIETPGTFFKGDLDEAFDRLSDYIIRCYSYYSVNIPEQWKLGENGFVGINKGVYAFIMLLSDIVDHLIKEGICNSNSSIKSLYDESKTYIDALINFTLDITQNEIQELKSKHGSGGDTKYWRGFQLAIRKVHSNFNPEGLDDYLKKESKEYNTEAFKMIREIETFFKSDFKLKLEEFYGTNWFKKGVPPETAKKAVELAYDKNLKIDDDEEEIQPWDCLTIIAYRTIARKSWKEVFEQFYTKPDEKKISGGSEAKTSWMVKVERVRNEIVHQYSVTKEDYDYIEEIYKWLIHT